MPNRNTKTNNTSLTMREIKRFKETASTVPLWAEKDRRPVLVKTHPDGLTVKAKGRRNTYFITFEEIFAQALKLDAERAMLEEV